MGSPTYKMIDEEHAYLRIYGLIADGNTQIHTIFVVYDEEDVDLNSISCSDTIHYLFGIDEQYHDGAIKEFIDKVRAILDDEHSKAVMEELICKGFNHYREHADTIKLDQKFEFELDVESELGVNTCAKLAPIMSSEWLDNVLEEFFLMGVGLGLSRPQYQVIGIHLN